MKCLLCCLILLLSVSLLAVALLMIFTSGGKREDPQDKQRIILGAGEDGSAVTLPPFSSEPSRTNEGLAKSSPESTFSHSSSAPDEKLPTKYDTLQVPKGRDSSLVESIRILPIQPGQPPFPKKSTTTIAPTTTTTTMTVPKAKVHGVKQVETTTKPDRLLEPYPNLQHHIQIDEKNVIKTTELKEHCEQYRQMGYQSSGVYTLSVPGYGEFYAFCQMDAGYGWMILQRRTGDSLPFWNGTFSQYAIGFGDPAKDHWLGLDRLYAFQALNHKLQMRIQIIGDLCGTSRSCSGQPDGFWWGDWDFSITSRTDKYRLKNLKVVNGNLSDPSQPDKDPFWELSNDQRFTTVDADNDQSAEQNCAEFLQRGAWWHKDCTYAALNGKYGSRNGRTGSHSWWYTVPESSRSYTIKPRQSVILFRVLE